MGSNKILQALYRQIIVRNCSVYYYFLLFLPICSTTYTYYIVRTYDPVYILKCFTVEPLSIAKNQVSSFLLQTGSRRPQKRCPLLSGIMLPKPSLRRRLNKPGAVPQPRPHGGSPKIRSNPSSQR